MSHHCQTVVVKNTPINSDPRDIVTFIVYQGCPAIESYSIYKNNNGLYILFINFYNIVSALSTVLHFNNIVYYGRNLKMTMHKDSKLLICDMLWDNYSKTSPFTTTNLIENDE